MSTILSGQAQQFLRKHIRSVWQLELMQFLRNQNRAYTADELAKALYMSGDVIERALAGFEKSGIVSTASSGQLKAYLFAPATDELRDAAAELLETYNVKRLQMINLIYAVPIQEFSDAFRLRQEED